MQVFHYQEEKYISKYKFQREDFCQSLLLLQSRKSFSVFRVKNGDANNRIAQHHYRRNIESTWTLRHLLRILQAAINDSL